MNNKNIELYSLLKINPEVEKVEIPVCVLDGIGEKYKLREYQEKAIKNFIYYMNNKNYYQGFVVTDNLYVNKNHLLFNVATGGGKTLLMACIILYLHNEFGYNNFLFLSHLNSINTKTYENFFNKNSSKYLFCENIDIKKTSFFNFEEDNNSIQISIESYQGLDSLLKSPKENAFNLSDIKNKKIVIIADEAHHLNAGNGNDKEAGIWEEDLNRVLNRNDNNFLIEFTATIDWYNQILINKYSTKCLYRYDLKEFYGDGYTKFIDLIQRDVEIDNLMFGAVILSEYRKFLFSSLGENIKPVILFKSKTIKESEENNKKFIKIIEELDEKKLYNYYNIFKNSEDNKTKIAFDYLNEKCGKNFVNFIKIDFAEGNILNTNKESEIDDNAVLLNTLENTNNNIRAIFSVDKLNEGWDVLNLFDIVKLYTTQTTKETTKEVQLIGRGARYCPFAYEDFDFYRRKFDCYSDYSILERLYFHSVQDNAAIAKLKDELGNIGLPIEERKKIKIKMNEKAKKILKDAKVFVNEKKKKELVGDDYNIFEDIRMKLERDDYKINIPSNIEKDYNLMDEDDIKSKIKDNESDIITLSMIDYHIKWSAIVNNMNYNFGNLYKRLHLNSFDEFIEKLDDIEIKTTGWSGTNESKYYVYSQVLNEIYNKILGKELKKFVGSKTFVAKNFSDLFRNYLDYYTKTLVNKEVDCDGRYCAYDKGDLTSEEESFVGNFFRKINDKLSAKCSNICLLRNEKVLKLYQFDNGVGFEPDFILFLKKDGIEYQIFIEPKGNHLIDYDEDKNEFLKQITKFFKSKEIKLLNNKKILNLDTPNYKLIGLQLYNSNIELKDKRMEREFEEYVLK